MRRRIPDPTWLTMTSKKRSHCCHCPRPVYHPRDPIAKRRQRPFPLPLRPRRNPGDTRLTGDGNDDDLLDANTKIFEKGKEKKNATHHRRSHSDHSRIHTRAEGAQLLRGAVQNWSKRRKHPCEWRVVTDSDKGWKIAFRPLFGHCANHGILSGRSRLPNGDMAARAQ